MGATTVVTANVSFRGYVGTFDVNQQFYASSEDFRTVGTLTPLAPGTYPDARISNEDGSLSLDVTDQQPVRLRPTIITCD